MWVPAAVQRGRAPTAPNHHEGDNQMTVLDRSELQASSLADLHVIADQIGLEGFRRLRKADLIDAILGEKSPPESDSNARAEEAEPRRNSNGGSSDEAPEHRAS